MLPEKPLVLTYSHNVIEHLGLKLYQNRPTRVIAELVSNGWDADAACVWVELGSTSLPPPSTSNNVSASVTSSDGAVEERPPERWIAVHDCGCGMTHDQLADRFLVIGAPKRLKPGERSKRNRPLMGRKGIGKLAPFGIAKVVDVVTVAMQDGAPTVTWIRLDLDGIKAQAQVGETAKYTPTLLADRRPMGEVLKLDDPTGQVALFATRIAEHEGTGTLVVLHSLSIHKSISEVALVEALGRRFTATTTPGFDVRVGDTQVATAVALPHFEFRIPEEGFLTETVGEHEVRYWAGFVKSASWPADEAGVGVYAHGKICQDRPFSFGAKGKEIFARYMYAVVEADWLDELDEDIISTDRTSLNWDSPAADTLYKWGKSKVNSWIDKFETWRRGQEKKSNQERIKKGIESNIVPAITVQEQEQVAALLSEISPNLGKDEDAKNRLAHAVATAWVQEPMRDLIQSVWTEIGQDGGSAPHVFSGLVEKLVAYSIPESLSLAVVFAQRAFALTKLYDFVHHQQEVDLQHLLEEFPWIIEPDSAYLTANQPLKTVLIKAEAEGQIPSGRQKVVAGTPDVNKPDFVFLSSPDETRIVVVELKNPQLDLTMENREQLGGYLTFLEAHYPAATLKGYLIGRAPSNMKVPRQDMEIVPWTEVMKRSRSRYITFLAAMLATVPAETDVRVEQVRDFAGPEVWEMLKKLGARNPKLSKVMAKFA